MEHKKKAIIILVLTTSFWGGNFVIGKLVVGYLTPFIMSFFRWLIALLLLIPLLYREGIPTFNKLKGHWTSLIIMAISGVFGFNTLVYYAVKYTTSVNAALVNSLTPVVIVILSTIFLADRLTNKQLVGITISFIGVLVVVSQGTISTFTEFQFNAGDLIMLVAVILWAIYSILMKKLSNHLSSLTITTISASIGLLLLIPFAIWDFIRVPNIEFNTLSVLGLLYIGIFASVLAFLGWNEGVIHLGPGKASVFLNLIPVFAALFSYIFLNEGLSIYQIVGGIMVIFGVIITNYRSIGYKNK